MGIKIRIGKKKNAVSVDEWRFTNQNWKIVLKEIVNYAMTQLAEYYENNTVPVMLYPKSYADQKSFPYQKTYSLAILNLEHMDEYIKLIDSLTSHKNLVNIKEIK